MYFVCSFVNFREMDTVISERVRQFTPHALYHSQHLKVLSNHEVRMLTSAPYIAQSVKRKYYSKNKCNLLRSRNNDLNDELMNLHDKTTYFCKKCLQCKLHAGEIYSGLTFLNTW